MTPLALTLPPELIDTIADRVVELLKAKDRQAGSPYLTVDEAAAYLRCSRQSIYDRVHQDALTPCRDGRRLLFHRNDLDAYVQGLAA